MAITNTSTQLAMDSVVAIQVSPIVLDTQSGLYKRVIQFYDQAITSSVRPVIEVDLSATTAAAIEIQTPTLMF